MKTWQIKKMSEDTIKKMRKFILLKYGKTRTKESLLARELDNAINFYLENQHTHEGSEVPDPPTAKKLKAIAEDLKEKKEAKGMIYAKDITESIEDYAGSDPRTVAHYRQLLKDRKILVIREEEHNIDKMLNAQPMYR